MSNIKEITIPADGQTKDIDARGARFQVLDLTFEDSYDTNKAPKVSDTEGVRQEVPATQSAILEWPCEVDTFRVEGTAESSGATLKVAIFREGQRPDWRPPEIAIGEDISGLQNLSQVGGENVSSARRTGHIKTRDITKSGFLQSISSGTDVADGETKRITIQVPDASRFARITGSFLSMDSKGGSAVQAQVESIFFHTGNASNVSKKNALRVNNSTISLDTGTADGIDQHTIFQPNQQFVSHKKYTVPQITAVVENTSGNGVTANVLLNAFVDVSLYEFQ